MNDNTPTSAIIYHRIDCDGMCSYAVARRWFELQGYSVTPYPYNYGDEVPELQDLASYDQIVIADVMFPVETMKALLQQTIDNGQTLIWIDHQKSDIELSIAHGFDCIPGARQNGIAACELVWQQFFSSDAPMAVKYISAYDVYDKKRLNWEGRVLPFQYGLRSVYGLDAERFAQDFQRICRPQTERAIIERGRAILDYARDSGGRGVSTYGFPVTIAGRLKGICCMTNQFGLLAFEAAMDREGCSLCVCVNRLSADSYKVSAYGLSGRNELDLSQYMSVHYGGGGHFNAAGGTLNLQQFIRLITAGEL